MQYSTALETEYLELWKKASIRPEKFTAVEAMAQKVIKNKARYEVVAAEFKCPWWWVGLVHAMESSCDFGTWLANGDPIARPTTHVPAGLTCNGTWEDAARVSLKEHGMAVDEWTLGRCFYEWERYNGFGYRSHGDVSDYLWSFTDQERPGRYVSDGTWSATAWSDQPSCGAMLRYLFNMGVVELSVPRVADPAVSVDEQVAWLKIYPLVIGGQPLIGVAANRDASTLATWTGTDRKALVQFLSRFPNANNVHFANTTEAWPGDYAPTPAPKPAPKFPLAVPFFPQLDNPRFPSGTCNVTSVAMVLAYFGTKPKDPAEQLEMEVLRWMEDNGLDRHVHMDLTKAIQHYGYKNTFSTEATLEQIKNHLDLGFPCIVSGMFTASGHIIVLTGYDSGGFWVNDPYGEWCSSGYEKEPIESRGKGLHYSFKLICNVSGGDGSIWCHFPSK